MKLTLIRKYPKGDYTLGDLYINGQWFCNTLEPPDVGLYSYMSVEEIKKAKRIKNVCIPYGTYQVSMDIVSPRFSQSKYHKQYAFCDAKLPRLISVKGFYGVLIHIGNKASGNKENSDSIGCILVGYNKAKGKVLESSDTFKKLYEILLTDKDNISIEIVKPK